MPPRFSLTYFDPPQGLERHILALFHFTWEEADIRDRHPGALPQLVLFPHGNGVIRFGENNQRVEGEAHMFSGFSKAAPFTMEGPWHAVGISLSPLGWAALAQRPANEWLDQFIEPAELLGSEIDVFAAETNARYRDGLLTGEEACLALAHWIEPRLGAVPPAHQALIEQTVGWLGTALNPEIDALFPRLAYSRRQAERLVERYFGLPPAALARKYRAVRAASLLAQESLSDEAEANIAEAFYDQPHMVREIRRYCGYTPTRLGGPSDMLFQTMLQMKNFDRLRRFWGFG